MPALFRRSLVGVLLAALLGSCGGGGDEESVQDLLDKAFKSDIKSADLKLDGSLQVKGSPQLERPVRVKASGPFASNEGKLPSLDVELQIGSAGGGQTVQTGFVSTGDRAFVKFQDVYYEQPASEVRKANASIQKNQGKERGSLGQFGVDPRKWLVDAKDEGSEKVAGEDTRHVSGALDVTALLNDLNEFVRKSSGAIGSATGQAPPRSLSKDDIARIEQVVETASFDVYVGEDDDTIRRLSGTLRLAIPEEFREQANGIEGGSLEFTVEFGDVNGDQEIEAPAKSRPLSDLTKSLGGGRGLGQLGGGAGGGSGGATGTQTSPTTPPASGGASPDSEAFKAYAECLEKSRPQDTDALQRCSELLEQGR